MLVLSRKEGQSITIDNGVVITIAGIRPNLVRVGIDAPDEVKIVRTELLNQKDHKHVHGNESGTPLVQGRP